MADANEVDVDLLERIQQQWKAQWPPALRTWSRFVQLSEPIWCLHVGDEHRAGISDSFAMIRLHDHRIVVSIRQIAQRGLEAFAHEVLAHEIGHHVYCPADLNDHARLIARTRAGLPTVEHLAAFVANLYTDLLINDRLQRIAELNMLGVYQSLQRASGGEPPDRLWTFYMRIYEHLWRLPSGSVATGEMDERLNEDAQLGARLVRSYAKDWLGGAGRFAALCFPYVAEDNAKRSLLWLRGWLDSLCAGSSGMPDGLVAVDPLEQEGAIHPVEDPALSGLDLPAHDGDPGRDRLASRGRAERGGKKSEKTFRSPVEYAELLRAIGSELDIRQVIANYYRERAMPYLIPFPAKRQTNASDPFPEGTELWDVESPLTEIDWLATLANGAQIIPGVTTRRRLYGDSAGDHEQRLPLDLYLGVDCSGSMGNPARQLSYPVLAGAVLALSALRAGARVKVVLSGEPGETLAMDGFCQDRTLIMQTLTHYLGTGYAFGIHRLRETFDMLPVGNRAVHIVIVSDNDMFRILDEESQGESGWEVAERALSRCGGGGTFVLQLPNYGGQTAREQLATDVCQRIVNMGWQLYLVRSMEELVDFARAFARTNYARGATS